jgi:hypothetical protein
MLHAYLQLDGYAGRTQQRVIELSRSARKKMNDETAGLREALASARAAAMLDYERAMGAAISAALRDLLR